MLTPSISFVIRVYWCPFVVCSPRWTLRVDLGLRLRPDPQRYQHFSSSGFPVGPAHFIAGLGVLEARLLAVLHHLGLGRHVIDLLADLDRVGGLVHLANVAVEGQGPFFGGSGSGRLRRRLVGVGGAGMAAPGDGGDDEGAGKGQKSHSDGEVAKSARADAQENSLLGFQRVRHWNHDLSA
jgi:hypothetical protein